MRELTRAYQLLSRLGHGAMAEVHLAEDRKTRRRVAVKRMLPHHVQDPTLRARFDGEMELLEGLSHPNIVTLVEEVVDEGRPAMVLEHIPGPSLKGLVGAAKKLPTEVAVRITAELLSGLGYAHDATDARNKPLGLVHRDVTPSNILFGASARPVLIDFGVARTDARAPLTATGAVVGKVGYLAPEIARGESVDVRADLFSVGALFFELVCGEPAYQGATLGDVMNRVASGGHEMPLRYRPDLSAAQEAFLIRGIACAPEARFQDAWEMSGALHEAFESAADAQLIELVEGLFPGTTGAMVERTMIQPDPTKTLTMATKSIVDAPSS